MKDDEVDATKIWNGPKCPRCEAMESKLRACLMANETWAKNFNALNDEYRRTLAENVKLRKYVSGAWGQA
jgi:hypothetical protein